MLYLHRGALSSEARFMVSFGMVWFGDRVVYPGLPSEDRAAKHMGKLLLAQLMASAETPEPTQSCLQSQAGDKFLLQRWSAPQEPKTPKATFRNGKDKLALLPISFFEPSKPKNRVERGQGAVWHPITIREKGCTGGWAGTRSTWYIQSQWHKATVVPVISGKGGMLVNMREATSSRAPTHVQSLVSDGSHC